LHTLHILHTLHTLHMPSVLPEAIRPQLEYAVWATKITTQLDHTSNSREFVQYISLREWQLISTFPEMNLAHGVGAARGDEAGTRIRHRAHEMPVSNLFQGQWSSGFRVKG